ncbi:MAG: twin-arginine translocation signal domain-containing protein, partial [Bacteroidales bacterium]|nr:twin-arginine translocation signal domain-containing protein [Bacteroidales bacterium]
MERREFLKTTAALGAGLAIASCSVPSAERKVAAPVESSRSGARMKLSWFPYEIQLAHTFTVASYSRTTTPDVQVEIEYDGITGYGEASM